MLKKNVLVGLILVLFAGLAAADATQFKVRIENISQPEILKSSTGHALLLTKPLAMFS